MNKALIATDLYLYPTDPFMPLHKPSERNGTQKIITAGGAAVTSLGEIFVLVVIMVLFHQALEFMLKNAAPPTYVVQLIDHTETGLLAVELLFVLFSLVISLILLARNRSVQGNGNSFMLFLEEAGASGLCMFIMIGCAWLIALSEGSYVPSSIEIKRLMVVWALNGVFLIFWAGFLFLVLSSMYNAAKIKLLFFVP